MRVAKFIHSCLQIEKNGTRILFDPGKFSFVDGTLRPEQFEGLSAIVLTHYHPDHVDEAILERIVATNPGAVLLANSEICGKLREFGLECETFESGTRTVRGIRLEALDAPHAVILGNIPPRNIAYVVDGTLLHPGDSFDASLDAFKNIPVLALPIMAPWCTEPAAAAFAERLRPKQIIPIHDGYVKDFFLEARHQNYQRYFEGKGIKFLRFARAGDGADFG